MSRKTMDRQWCNHPHCTINQPHRHAGASAVPPVPTVPTVLTNDIEEEK